MTTDHERLVERLRATEICGSCSGSGDGGADQSCWACKGTGGEQRNPDGPEAADAIQSLSLSREDIRREAVAEVVAAMREAISQGYQSKDLKHGEQCEHGCFGFQDCIGCYDEFLSAKLDHLGKGER